MIDTNDVDPIAEAEVYMAYGRDAQAEEILKDAIAKEPKRHELHLKLLEMYAASKNLSAFETVAGELYTSLGAEDPTWAKVAEIGIKLEPNNPLYQVNSQPTGSLDATDFANSPLAAEKDLDFSFDNDALTQGFAPTGVAAVAGLALAGAAIENTSAKESLDLDMNEFKDSSELNTGELNSKAIKTDSADLNNSAHLNSANLDSLDLEMFAADELVHSPASDTQDISAADDNAMDFDMGSFGNIEPPVVSKPIQAVTEEFGHTMPSDAMPSLDVPTFAAPHFMPETNKELSGFDELSASANELTESFEFPLTETSAAGLDMGSMDAHFTDAKFSDETDFNFDIPTISSEAESFKNTDFSEANTFDLTTIDLDLNDSVANKVDDSVHVITPSGVEPVEIETKLDLVAAYIEMDDKEGAKELLDEVIKEGGANQRKRAEALLEKLV